MGTVSERVVPYLLFSIPQMHELDKGRYTFRPNETGYVKNPTAQNITNYINNTNYLGTDS